MNDDLTDSIYNFVFAAIIWLLVAAAILIIFIYYNFEFFDRLMKLLIPAIFYGTGIALSMFFRRKKDRAMKSAQGSSEITIYLSQFDLLKHDLLMFLTPLMIIAVAYFVKKEVSALDIVYSVIALVGLYLSELIYKRKIN